ncbi:MAG TPA: 50S ribosomal protein L21e [Candidatus Nanoarchaeia archaeon]|nr:50S ribosomal protein L21e [Candidatus Nanoarchaeia archaeon]
MKRIGGSRRKTRHLFSKGSGNRGKMRLSRFLQEFQPGERVHLTVEPAYQKGMYFRRFAGKTGTVMKKEGKCYHVRILDFTKEKTVVVHPVHLKRFR